MPAKKETNDPSTEEKIKNAARTVFHQKGFAATRTRDIAEAAGINLALLNYYFRSKQKLFDIIMLETLQAFVQSMGGLFNDESSTLDEKVKTLVERYIDLLIQQPEIPLFIMSEIRTNPQALIQKINIQEVLMKSHFVRQFQEAVAEGRIAPQNLMQFLMNIVGLTVFPFIASPMLKMIGNLEDKQFNQLMLERKTLIPKWMDAIMKMT